jgi:hypothetical protein
MPSRLDLSEDSKISLPAKNLIAILGAVAIGTFSYFNLLERLTLVETELQLITKDLEAANDFIDGVPKGDMVSPQIQELFMLVEFISKNQDKLKEQMEKEIPMIQKNDMVIQFHEERIIQCKEVKAELENDMGRLRIKRIIE